jgi:site-specific DNA-methyltransferase (adenine-specific)/modification methylase
MLEGRNFIGIERNKNVALFKNEKIDYIKVTENRLCEAWQSLPVYKRGILHNILGGKHTNEQ